MPDFQQFQESLLSPAPTKKKIPDMLNVLTILTFIASAYYAINGFVSYATICTTKIATLSKVSQTPGAPFSGMMDSLVEMAKIQCEQRLPILLVTIGATLLCVAGAILMRKLKKTGFFMYAFGEIACPAYLVYLGVLPGLFRLWLIFPVLFLILYATQVRHMNK